MANFRVGQRVVCIRRPEMNEIVPECRDSVPVVGTVYTVNDKGISPWGQPVIGCAELDQTNFYEASLFRPAHTIESDSEMFRRISEYSLGRLEVLEDVLNEQYLCDETHE